jgi:hypothetical protein
MKRAVFKNWIFEILDAIELSKFPFRSLIHCRYKALDISALKTQNKCSWWIWCDFIVPLAVVRDIARCWVLVLHNQLVRLCGSSDECAACTCMKGKKPASNSLQFLGDIRYASTRKIDMNLKSIHHIFCRALRASIMRRAVLKVSATEGKVSNKVVLHHGWERICKKKLLLETVWWGKRMNYQDHREEAYGCLTNQESTKATNSLTLSLKIASQSSCGRFERVCLHWKRDRRNGCKE